MPPFTSSPPASRKRDSPPDDPFFAIHLQSNPSPTQVDFHPVLIPRAYQLTLHNDHHLRNQLHYRAHLQSASFSEPASAHAALAASQPSSWCQDHMIASPRSSKTACASSSSSSTPLSVPFTKLIPLSAPDSQGTVHNIWTDRFDVAHLLSTLPPNTKSITAPSPSRHSALPSSTDSEDEQGFSDLPSDSEDLFFLSSAEASDYLRQKKTDRLEQERQKRMAAILALEASTSTAHPEPLSMDVEPSTFPEQSQYELMQRTATILLGSTNRTVLEMKILANHGSDPRFAFLRKGARQAHAPVWQRLKSGTTECERSYGEMKKLIEGETATTKSVATNQGGLLVGYGSDSDSDSNSDTRDQPGLTEQAQTVQPQGKSEELAEELATTHEDDLTQAEKEEQAIQLKRKQRLERAKEWAKRRREEKAATEA